MSEVIEQPATTAYFPQGKPVIEAQWRVGETVKFAPQYKYVDMCVKREGDVFTSATCRDLDCIIVHGDRAYLTANALNLAFGFPRIEVPRMIAEELNQKREAARQDTIVTKHLNINGPATEIPELTWTILRSSERYRLETCLPLNGIHAYRIFDAYTNGSVFLENETKETIKRFHESNHNTFTLRCEERFKYTKDTRGA